MAGWVCSARKLVVSSFVSFAEEMEHVVLVLTDAEKIQDMQRNQHSKSGMANTPDECETSVFLLHTGQASSHQSALTTQPGPSASMLPSASSMTSLPSATSSSFSYSSIPYLKSSPTSRSLPDISNTSEFNKPSSRSASEFPSSFPPRLHSKTSKLGYNHNSFVHRSRNKRHSPIHEMDITDSSTPKLHQPTARRIPQNSRPSVVVGSKRPKEMSMFNLKRPGKVVRTSTYETKPKDNSSIVEQQAPDSSTIIPRNDFDEYAEEGQSEKENQILPLTKNRSSRHPPSDLNLNIRNQRLESANREFKIEHIQRISLVDKLSQILHSTLVTISNLLRLEDEDRIAICQSRRSSYAQAKALEMEKAPSGRESSKMETSTSKDSSMSDSNLTLSRINSLVSLESFEVLSKEDENLCSAPVTTVLKHGNSPELSPKSEKCSKTILCENNQKNRKVASKETDDDVDDFTNIQMSSSIEFINFEVSDLITKRYFDSKTQRHLAFTTDMGLPSPRFDTEMDYDKGACLSVEDSDAKETFGDANSKELLTDACLLQDNDDESESSASFDVISEDMCQDS